MAAPRDVFYARTRDGIDIAYTVFGEGPDLIIAPGFVTHLDLMWDLGGFRGLLDLGNFFRVIIFDKRGTGLSDRSMGFGSLEDRAEDVRAVADHAGAESAIVYGISEGGPLCIYYAVTHPERVRALILYGTAAHFRRSDDAGRRAVGPMGMSFDEFITWLRDRWGKGEAYSLFMSNPPDEEASKRVLARYERAACTPQMCCEIMQRNIEINVEPLLPSVVTKTLVVHCKGDPVIPIENARRMAGKIPGARMEEIDGDFHGSWLVEDNALVGKAMMSFLSEVLGGEGTAPAAMGNREVASVLFTDIVSSTERAAQVGDASWRGMLERFEETASAVATQTGGAMVKTTGDGVVATFPSPSQAVSAAHALQDAALPLGVRIRSGVHTGEIERRADDIAGMGVHIAARVSAMADGGEILVSRTTRDLAVGSHLNFEDRGTHALKGVPEPWQVFAVV